MSGVKRTGERVAQYIDLDFCLFWTIVHYLKPTFPLTTKGGQEALQETASTHVGARQRVRGQESRDFFVVVVSGGSFEVQREDCQGHAGYSEVGWMDESINQ